MQAFFTFVSEHLLFALKDHHDRHVLVDQRNRPVLHLTRWVAFGVDVGDLLELQGAFQSNRIVAPRPKNSA